MNTTTTDLGSIISSAYVHGFQMKRKAGYRDAYAAQGRADALRLFNSLVHDGMDRDQFFDAIDEAKTKHPEFQAAFFSTLDSLRNL